MRFPIRFLILLMLLAGCTRPDAEQSSGITIDTRAFRKVSAQSMPPENETCYAVDFRGPGIDESPTGSCYGARGANAGFVKGGETLSLKVPRGTDRTLRLLMYLRAADAECPEIGFALGNGPDLTKIYQIASMPRLELSKEVETIEVSASFPGSSNTIASGASCTGAGGGGGSTTASWRAVRNVIASGSTSDADLRVKLPRGKPRGFTGASA